MTEPVRGRTGRWYVALLMLLVGSVGAVLAYLSHPTTDVAYLVGGWLALWFVAAVAVALRWSGKGHWRPAALLLLAPIVLAPVGCVTMIASWF